MSVNKLNVAVMISSGLESGGGFQYEFMVLNLLKKYHNNKDICLHYFAPSHKIAKDYSKLELDISILEENFLQKSHRLLLSNIFSQKILNKIGLGSSSIEKKLIACNVDLIYFLSPSMKSWGLNSMPYIFTLWDLGHLEMPEFPEVSGGGVFELRETLYSKSLKKAIKVIVDSSYSKEYAIKKYNLDRNRVKTLKYLPNIREIQSNTNIDVKQKYNIKNDYIFYPAQFWAHKNHIFILRAIKILKEKKGVDVDVIFSGSDKGNLNYILQKAKDFGIDDLINYIGFAPDEEIPLLYKESLALVMPTYLGPTNIPPLEAFFYETPVCYSDTPFFREQVGDAVFYIDLNNPATLVQNILTIKNDAAFVKEKILLGKKVLENWNEEDFYNKLLDILMDYKNIRQGWN